MGILKITIRRLGFTNNLKINMIYTAESVTAWHIDKICDQIADAILDECLRQDKDSRVAVEAIGGHGTVILVGEITTEACLDYCQIARKTYFDLTKKQIGVLSNLVVQSPEIAEGVDKGGAGDQGIMTGYACRENKMSIPQEMYLARKLLEPFESDGKSQVTINDGEITDIVLSIQGKSQEELKNYLINWYGSHLDSCNKELPTSYCNNCGSFNIGGLEADSGCTGRKIVVDQYGPRVPVGGGSFSGKDPTKVDRSGAYMARFMALDVLNESGADEVLVSLGYVIGKSEPIMKTAIINENYSEFVDLSKYDCRPEAIIERFDLKRPIYLQTARYGHFGIKNYPWEAV
ncbi:MAG: methionine adenosyltransferase domain-containing protein [Actinomycetota bacterium]